jgi:uncharacterized protein (TIGR02246 family)
MSDKDEIRELLARYCFHLDAEDLPAMATLFTTDGVWETDFGIGIGRDGIVTHARSLVTGPRPRRVHLTTNIVITLEGETATAISNWALVQNTPSGPIVGSGGAYRDQLAKVEGRWYFKHRTIDRFLAEGKP